jgi:hypothetical protein
MRNTKLKLCSLFMSIVMLLSLLPVTALAVDEINSLESLQSAIDEADSATTITLTGNIDAGTLEKPSADTGLITIPAGKDITIPSTSPDTPFSATW